MYCLRGRFEAMPKMLVRMMDPRTVRCTSEKCSQAQWNDRLLLFLCSVLCDKDPFYLIVTNYSTIPSSRHLPHSFLRCAVQKQNRSGFCLELNARLTRSSGSGHLFLLFFPWLRCYIYCLLFMTFVAVSLICLCFCCEKKREEEESEQDDDGDEEKYLAFRSCAIPLCPHSGFLAIRFACQNALLSQRHRSSSRVSLLSMALRVSTVFYAQNDAEKKLS